MESSIYKGLVLSTTRDVCVKGETFVIIEIDVIDEVPNVFFMIFRHFLIQKNETFIV